MTESLTDRADHITVILPAWDRYAGELLVEAVTSVAGQRPRPTILVVDNASDEPMPELPLANVLRSEERHTIGGARNLGLHSIDTEYVMFWDADDIMLPGTIASLLEAMEDDERLVAAGTRMLEENGRYHHWPRMRVQKLARWPRAYAVVHAVSSLFPTTGSVLIRSETMKAAQGFANMNQADDWVAGMSLALRGRIRILDVAGRVYRKHPESLSATWTIGDRLRSAKHVRARIRADAASPLMLRLATPLIALAQWFVLLVLRSLRLRLGRMRRDGAVDVPTPPVSSLSGSSVQRP